MRLIIFKLPLFFSIKRIAIVKLFTSKENECGTIFQARSQEFSREVHTSRTGSKELMLK